ncbi:carbohydrate-binding protein [Actinomyces faecalis]|uniref:carbohydrate-binding protein n=1 Tax=Actinomyces faecalis TaxID=2722820 RepID=UPI001C553EA4|nr:carbohydrate-binding protein [Actinomyces faecalis]
MITEDQFRAMTDEQWQALWDAVLVESGRRQTLASAPGQAERIAADYLDARDGSQPEATEEALADVGAWPEWVQPTGAHDAYPLGRVVAHEGRLWRSKHPANSWPPSTGDLWEEVTARPEDGTRLPGGGADHELVPDTPTWQAGASYTAGDLVSYGGTVYRCVQPHTSQTGWEPPGVPALWALA